MPDGALTDRIKFNDQGLVPVVTQDNGTGAVLMMAYASEEAVRLSVSTKRAHYYSRSRKKIWMKGETSGNIQHIIDIFRDCDSDALLYLVRQEGPACHTKKYSCFNNEGESDDYARLYKSRDALGRAMALAGGGETDEAAGGIGGRVCFRRPESAIASLSETCGEIKKAADACDKNGLRAGASELLLSLGAVLKNSKIDWDEILTEIDANIDASYRPSDGS
ncbi:MAG: phosphoribosyl-AMP cyclohydrolase [Defluviitaleaceae bacterium]|nr:phosphoribosyl-AMP cyclohydrolase [Defluviitaleaceae bacterium]